MWKCGEGRKNRYVYYMKDLHYPKWATAKRAKTSLHAHAFGAALPQQTRDPPRYNLTSPRRIHTYF